MIHPVTVQRDLPLENELAAAAAAPAAPPFFRRNLHDISCRIQVVSQAPLAIFSKQLPQLMVTSC